MSKSPYVVAIKKTGGRKGDRILYYWRREGEPLLRLPDDPAERDLRVIELSHAAARKPLTSWQIALGKVKKPQRDDARIRMAMDESGLFELSTIIKSAAEYCPTAGVYFLISLGKIVYIGQSLDIHRRVAGHFLYGTMKFDRVFTLPCPKEAVDALEQRYIAKFKPPHNTYLFPGGRKRAVTPPAEQLEHKKSAG